MGSWLCSPFQPARVAFFLTAEGKGSSNQPPQVAWAPGGRSSAATEAGSPASQLERLADLKCQGDAMAPSS